MLFQIRFLDILACLDVLAHDGWAVEANLLIVSRTVRKTSTRLMDILCPVLRGLCLLRPSRGWLLCCNLLLANSLFLPRFLDSISELNDSVLVIFRPGVFEYQSHVNNGLWLLLDKTRVGVCGIYDVVSTLAPLETPLAPGCRWELLQDFSALIEVV